MNTKVEEALGVLDAFARCAQSQVCCGNTVGGGMDENGNGEPPSCCGSPLADDDLLEARTTLAAHIAQQDATIARMFTREQAAELMRGMLPGMATMSTHGTNATCNGHDACRAETLARIEAWLNQEQVK